MSYTKQSAQPDGVVGREYWMELTSWASRLSSSSESLPFLVPPARSSVTVYIPSDETSIERDNPMIPPE
jgi:hypothetical protein